MGAKIISVYCFLIDQVPSLIGLLVFSLVSCVAAVHGIRAAMQSLKKTGTDFTSAKGME
jgi:hypothetical protein